MIPSGRNIFLARSAGVQRPIDWILVMDEEMVVSGRGQGSVVSAPGECWSRVSSHAHTLTLQSLILVPGQHQSGVSHLVTRTPHQGGRGSI